LKEPASDPKHFLGAVIKPWSIPGDSRKIWSMTATKYIEEALRNLKIELDKSGVHLVGKPATPMRTGYRPELDTTALLPPEQANYYMSLIGVLRWAVELGRVDIHVDVALLSSHMAAPRIGHMEQVLHIFSYLKNHLNSSLVFDPNIVAWDESMFKKYDWTDFYKDACEAIPSNAPPPRGNEVQTNAFVDASHASNKVTGRSHTGILIFLNMAPIIWYSKKQNTVESSTFGSEFVAMRIGVEMLESLRYKLRMFGIPLEGSANVFCDNQSVVINASIPSSTLKKKHNAIAYHKVREAIAAGIIRVAKVDGDKNLADLLMKSLPRDKLKFLIQRILW
jgi:hypothetical protein